MKTLNLKLQLLILNFARSLCSSLKFKVQNAKFHLRIKKCFKERIPTFNFGLQLLILNFALLTLLLPQGANAGLLLKSPSYLGLNTGLVGYWSFNGPDMAGNIAYDRSGNGNNGTLTNGPRRIVGKVGQALEFDGVDDYVTLTNSSSIQGMNSAGTVNFWIRLNTTADTNDIPVDITGTNNSGLVVIFNADSTIALLYGIGGSTVRTDSTTVLLPGQWYMVTARWTPAGGNISVNSVQEGADATAPSISITGTTEFGSQSGTLRFVNGQIDEIRFYNRALSGDEVKRLYNIGRGITYKAPDNKGLVGYWRLDEGTGVTAGDFSGNGNNGTLTNGPVWVDGKFGKALESDGSNDFVSVSDSNSLDFGTGDFTISAWIKTSQLTEGQILRDGCGGDGAGYIFGINQGRLRACIKDAAGNQTNDENSNGPTVNDGKWHQVAVVFKRGGNLIFHKDGVSTTGSSISTVTGSVSNTGSKVIGSRTGTEQFFRGFFDEVRIYNRALSVDEVAELYNYGLARIGATQNRKVSDGMVGYWSFNGPDMAGSTAYDRSGQNNNGTLTDGPLRIAGKIGQALEFDGVDDDVNVSQSNSLEFGSNNFTVSAWIKTDRSSKERYFIHKGGTGGEAGWYLQLKQSPAGIFRFKIGDGTNNVNPDSTQRYDDDTWHHLVGVRDGSTLRMYADGIEIITGNASSIGSVSNTSRALGIGRRTDSTLERFDGPIDEVRVYNRALSADEVKRLYNMGR